MEQMEPNPSGTPWVQKNLPIGLDIIDDLIPVHTCRQLVKWFEEAAPFQRSMVGDPATVREDDIRTSDSTTFPFIHFDIPEYAMEANKAVWKAIDAYSKATGAPIAQFEDPSVQRYEPGQKYDWHMDGSAMNGRSVSAVLYLNEVEEGGETEFGYFNLKVTPKPGRLVIFPAGFAWMHRALPPVKGVKYAIAYFVRG